MVTNNTLAQVMAEAMGDDGARPLSELVGICLEAFQRLFQSEYTLDFATDLNLTLKTFEDLKAKLIESEKSYWLK